jgi:hypothetical protein
MRPVRLLYYLLFVGIEAIAVVGALLGIVFLFLPFVVLKAAWVLVTGGKKATSEPM